ncbi:unnamed protein product [Amoebophrya sp. A25]|nr:unnamed protein product [Amoebophrya sp. A25]|eukprot:GSA25T00018711001.1
MFYHVFRRCVMALPSAVIHCFLFLLFIFQQPWNQTSTASAILFKPRREPPMPLSDGTAAGETTVTTTGYEDYDLAGGEDSECAPMSLLQTVPKRVAGLTSMISGKEQRAAAADIEEIEQKFKNQIKKPFIEMLIFEARDKWRDEHIKPAGPKQSAKEAGENPPLAANGVPRIGMKGALDKAVTAYDQVVAAWKEVRSTMSDINESRKRLAPLDEVQRLLNKTSRLKPFRRAQLAEEVVKEVSEEVRKAWEFREKELENPKPGVKRGEAEGVDNLITDLPDNVLRRAYEIESKRSGGLRSAADAPAAGPAPPDTAMPEK